MSPTSIDEALHFIVDFDDGTINVPRCWLTEDLRICAFPPWYKDVDQRTWDKRVEEGITPEADWTDENVLRIRAYGADFQSVRRKLPEAQLKSETDVNSHSEGRRQKRRRRRPRRYKGGQSVSGSDTDEDQGLTQTVKKLKLPVAPTVEETTLKCLEAKKHNLPRDKKDAMPQQKPSIKSQEPTLKDARGCRDSSVQSERKDSKPNSFKSSQEPTSKDSRGCRDSPVQNERKDSKPNSFKSSQEPTSKDSRGCRDSPVQNERKDSKPNSSKNSQESTSSNARFKERPLPMGSGKFMSMERETHRDGAGCSDWKLVATSPDWKRTPLITDESRGSAAKKNLFSAELDECITSPKKTNLSLKAIPYKQRTTRASPYKTKAVSPRKSPLQRKDSPALLQPSSAQSKERAIELATSMSEIDFRAFVINNLLFLKSRIGRGGSESVSMPAAGEVVVDPEVLSGLPATSLKEFLTFDALLADKSFALKVVKQLMCLRQPMLGSFIREVLRKLLTDQAASELSWHGLKGKAKMKDMNSKKIIFSTIRSCKKFKNVPDGEIVKEIMAWLRLAKTRAIKKMETVQKAMEKRKGKQSGTSDLPDSGEEDNVKARPRSRARSPESGSGDDLYVVEEEQKEDGDDLENSSEDSTNSERDEATGSEEDLMVDWD